MYLKFRLLGTALSPNIAVRGPLHRKSVGHASFGDIVLGRRFYDDVLQGCSDGGLDWISDT